MSSSIRGFPFELQIMHRKDFLPPPKLRSHSDRPILHCCRSSSSQASLASRFEICFTADLQRLGYDHSTTILDHPRPSYFLLPPHLLTTLGEHVQSRAENGNAKLGHMTPRWIKQSLVTTDLFCQSLTSLFHVAFCLEYYNRGRVGMRLVG